MTRAAPEWMLDRWVDVVGPVVGVGMVVWLGAITDWPGWWVSLMVLTALGAVGYLVIGTWGTGRPRVLAVAMGAAVVAASAGSVAAAAVHLHADRAVAADRDDLRRISGNLVCRILTTGTDADRTSALAAATGELAARLGSGSAAVDSTANGIVGPGTATQCTPVRVGLGAVGDTVADVVVAANLTERAGTDRSASGRVVAARLERVGGTWKVSALDLVR